MTPSPPPPPPNLIPKTPTGSSFFTLPRELRDMLYTAIIDSTALEAGVEAPQPLFLNTTNPHLIRHTRGLGYSPPLRLLSRQFDTELLECLHGPSSKLLRLSLAVQGPTDGMRMEEKLLWGDVVPFWGIPRRYLRTLESCCLEIELEPRGIDPWTYKAMLEEWMAGVVGYVVEIFRDAVALRKLGVSFAVEAYEDFDALRKQVRSLDQIKGIERVEIVVESRMGVGVFARIPHVERAFPRLDLVRVGERWEGIRSDIVVPGVGEDNGRERKQFEW